MTAPRRPPRYYLPFSPDFHSPSTIASGAEARFVEAVAGLRKSNNATFLRKINDLRPVRKSRKFQGHHRAA
jgi:hypothetical protein